MWMSEHELHVKSRDRGYKMSYSLIWIYSLGATRYNPFTSWRMVKADMREKSPSIVAYEKYFVALLKADCSIDVRRLSVQDREMRGP